MLFCSCEAAEVCAAHWCLKPGPSTELWLCHSTGLTLKSAEATAVSCCQQMLGFRFAFLGNNEIQCRSVEGTSLQAAGLMLLDSALESDPWFWGWGAGGAEDLRALQPSDKHCEQPHWAAKPAPSCYMWCYYRAKHLCSSGFKFLPCHYLVCYLRLLPGL